MLWTDTLIKRLQDSTFDIHAAEVIHKGERVLHHCFHEDRAYPVYSAAKSVTSLAFALAWDDGLVSPEMPFAPLLDRGYESRFPKGFEKLTFERLLTMTAGKFPFRPQGDDWLGYILSLDVDYSDRSFNYSNIPAYLVGAACENAVGQSLMEYLKKRLFDPMELCVPRFTTCPKGHFYGATGMEMTVSQLSALGKLCLDRGSFNGVQLISQGAISQAVAPHVFTGTDSYGYFFRVEKDCFAMVGKWGQRCIVCPEKQLVVTYLSNCPHDSQKLYGIVKSWIDEVQTSA